jgi:hypothetical protein
MRAILPVTRRWVRSDSTRPASVSGLVPGATGRSRPANDARKELAGDLSGLGGIADDPAAPFDAENGAAVEQDEVERDPGDAASGESDDLVPPVKAKARRAGSLSVPPTGSATRSRCPPLSSRARAFRSSSPGSMVAMAPAAVAAARFSGVEAAVAATAALTDRGRRRRRSADKATCSAKN